MTNVSKRVQSQLSLMRCVSIAKMSFVVHGVHLRRYCNIKNFSTIFKNGSIFSRDESPLEGLKCVSCLFGHALDFEK